MLETLSHDVRQRARAEPVVGAVIAVPRFIATQLPGRRSRAWRARNGAAVQRPARAAMAILVCGLALLFAREMLIVWGIPDDDLLDPFNDANTYLAAGERLNEGRALYELQPGDRPVLLLGDYPVPLYSPPPVAAIWRPLAALPFGFPLWVAAAWVALLGTVAYLVMKIGLRAAVLAAALSFPIGEQLVAANMTAFFPGLLVLAWSYRDDPRAGALIGTMSALKLAPAVMGGWFVGAQRLRGLAWIIAGGVVVAAIGAIGAGITNTVRYVEIAGTIPMSALSLSGQTGIGSLSPAMLVAGAALAAILRGWPRLSFAVGVVALVAGSPALYFSTLTLLLGVLVPLVPDRASLDAEVPHPYGPLANL